MIAVALTKDVKTERRSFACVPSKVALGSVPFDNISCLLPIKKIQTCNANSLIQANTERIVEKIDLKQLLSADYDTNPNGTLSIEFEKELHRNEFYLHIEIGKTQCNWQYRINGKRVASRDGIELNRELDTKELIHLKSCILDLPL